MKSRSRTSQRLGAAVRSPGGQAHGRAPGVWVRACARARSGTSPEHVTAAARRALTRPAMLPKPGTTG
jgi:hypothetical protein